jgi:hypothetical protein
LCEITGRVKNLRNRADVAKLTLLCAFGGKKLNIGDFSALGG